jgi:hypothetical protein
MNKYIELMEELLRKREEAGDLPEEVEADYAQRLDDIYWKLTNSEQDFLEKKLNVSIRMIKKGICQRCGAFGLNKNLFTIV